MRSESVGNDYTHIERVRAEAQEIAVVLSRRSGKAIIEVWNESLSLHRVRYEHEILEPPEEKE